MMWLTPPLVAQSQAYLALAAISGLIPAKVKMIMMKTTNFLKCSTVVVAVIAACLILTHVMHAEEGMWTFDKFPSQTLSAKYGFMPSQAWLDHVRLSSLRIAGGCSASFVSPQGLVMTNHHCVLECVQQLSTPKQNYETDGFVAKTIAEERSCPAFELDQL